MNLRNNLIQDNFPFYPNRPKNIQLLIGFLIRFKLKSRTLKIKRGEGSVFLSSSFPNHDSKSRKEKENKKKTQKPITNNKLYDACNECTYSACSNVQILVQLFKIYQQLT